MILHFIKGEHLVQYILLIFTGFLVSGRLFGGKEFGENDQKLQKNFKINIFWAKQWGELWEGATQFFVCLGRMGVPSPPQQGRTPCMLFSGTLVQKFLMRWFIL